VAGAERKQTGIIFFLAIIVYIRTQIKPIIDSNFNYTAIIHDNEETLNNLIY